VHPDQGPPPILGALQPREGRSGARLVTDSIAFDWAVAQKRKAAVVDQLVKGVEGLLKAGGITTFRGAGKLGGKGTVKVGNDVINAKDIVIATGSAISRIPLKGAEHTIDSDQILELKDVPSASP